MTVGIHDAVLLYECISLSFIRIYSIHWIFCTRTLVFIKLNVSYTAAILLSSTDQQVASEQNKATTKLHLATFGQKLVCMNDMIQCHAQLVLMTTFCSAPG